MNVERCKVGLVILAESLADTLIYSRPCQHTRSDGPIRLSNWAMERVEPKSGGVI